jgi:RNA-directed DNA polymerase
MRRVGSLFEKICSWENLELAARRVRKRKRYRIYAENFELRRESVLRRLRQELLNETWRPSTCRTFTIHDPKERLICAPSYPDRIVHHALCNIIGPVIERTLVDQSYSCRVGKGTGVARSECKASVAKYSHVLKLDVRKYFPSIDHALLKSKLCRLIKCAPTLRLIARIIDAWRDNDTQPQWFVGDDLLTPVERPHGLPIGSLTSQLFANLYLSRIDHLVLEKLRPSGYARYTDDLLLFSDDKRFLAEVRERLVAELRNERLMPHPTKCRVHACREGVPFLGFRYWPHRVRVLRDNRLRFEKRMHAFKRRILRGRADGFEKALSAFGWFQFVREYPVNIGLVVSECRYHSLSGVNPSSSGSNRVLRGGSWNNNPVNCRSANRNNNDPTNTNNNNGFRAVCVR